jgi:hypothetical protein
LSATVSVRDLGWLWLMEAAGLTEATVTLQVTVRWLALPAVADPAQAVSRAAVTAASTLIAARERMLMGPIPFQRFRRHSGAAPARQQGPVRQKAGP